MINEKKCENCSYYNRIGNHNRMIDGILEFGAAGDEYGSCLRFPPIGIEEIKIDIDDDGLDDTNSHPVWPVVFAYNKCGEFADKAYPVSVQKRQLDTWRNTKNAAEYLLRIQWILIITFALLAGALLGSYFSAGALLRSYFSG